MRLRIPKEFSLRGHPAKLPFSQCNKKIIITLVSGARRE
jgi:hypothetical protein